MLSNKQIEIQRMRFEKAIPMPIPECFVFVNYRYIQNQNLSIGGLPHTLKAYNCFFEAWIKCVESNEIELPIVTNSPMVTIAINEITKAIEAQGFRVKTSWHS